MRICVIIPTYNERENIALLIESLQIVFKRIPHDIRILVVDDNSPDRTAEIVQETMTRYQNVHLITGIKKGLGAAYIRGMIYAMTSLHADAVMQMDADFSHNPEDVPRLVESLDGGADFVIGSRYVKGGKIPEDWGIQRKLVSRWGNVFARYVAGLSNVRDCTAGFRAIRSSVLSKVSLETIGVQGYAFLMALLSRAVINKAVVREIPVVFVDRIRGKTKLGLSDIVEFIINAWWIRFERSSTFLKFAAVGLSGVFVNLVSFTLLLHVGLNKYLSSPIAIELSVVSNFILNNVWTFSSRDTLHKFHMKGLFFNIVSLISLFIIFTTFAILSIVFPTVRPQIHQAIGILPAMFVNYFMISHWAFREKLVDRE